MARRASGRTGGGASEADGDETRQDDKDSPHGRRRSSTHSRHRAAIKSTRTSWTDAPDRSAPLSPSSSFSPSLRGKTPSVRRRRGRLLTLTSSSSSLSLKPPIVDVERVLTDAERRVEQPVSSFLHEAAHLNFYRVHLLIFTFTPLVFSGIFYASNGPSPQNQIAYVDALFMCTSAMAVTGLNSVLLADLTTWQQFIIFVRTLSGHPR